MRRHASNVKPPSGGGLRRTRALTRISLRVIALALLTVVGFVLVEGCQEPTQVTLEVSLDTRRAQCKEITQGGTAITVGVEPYDTELRVSGGYVTAKTSACDDVTGEIGTLVITPSDANHAAVVVVVGYKGHDPTTCIPPTYAGCIVARRRFAFASHVRLRLPIRIDPDCADVPCDAFSTCSRGKCFDSQAECNDSSCSKPGELEDGGVDEAGIVEPDASGFDAPPPPQDGPPTGVDAPTDTLLPPPDSSGTTSYCDTTNMLHCGGSTGSCPNASCCPGNPDTCNANACSPSNRKCCSDGDCNVPLGYHCLRPPGPGAPAVCVLTQNDSGLPNPTCNGSDILTCGGTFNCTNCCPTPPSAYCGGNCPPEQHVCCKETDCPLGYTCNRAAGSGPVMCSIKPAGMPDGGVAMCPMGPQGSLFCSPSGGGPPVQCQGPFESCCDMGTGAGAQCAPMPTCGTGATTIQYCCNSFNCHEAGVCGALINTTPSTCN